jgi:uncharacterized protein YndB with AHSA1/START domain
MTAPELRLTRLVPATVEEVFRAWTDPEVMARWWGPGDNAVSHVELDPRPGGSYRLEFASVQGGTLVMAGTYIAVEPPRHLSFTWRWEVGGPDDVESRVTVELTPAGEHTELVIVHGGFPDEAAAGPYSWGWDAALPKLVALFE